MEKDADAYRTISEVSETLDIPPHVLRFWESKFPQIKPLKRGGGRRYYRRSDTEMLRTIRRLLYEDGYTIRGVQRLLRGRGAALEAALASTDEPHVISESTPNESVPVNVGGDRTSTGTALIRLQAEIAACRAVLVEALDLAMPPTHSRTDEDVRFSVSTEGGRESSGSSP